MKAQVYHQLKISGSLYNVDQLQQLAVDKTSQIDLQPWEYDFYNFIKEWISEKPKIATKTSGSTGHPKKIEITKNKMVQSAQMTGEFLGLEKDQQALLCLPVSTIAGKMMVVRAFVLGLNLFPVKSTGNPLKNIDTDFDFAAMTPQQVYNTLQEKDGRNKLNKIKNLIIGGGEIRKPLFKKIRNQLTNNAYHTYGMTETITHVAMKKLTGDKPDNCFNALPGVLFSLDERSCLVIRAPHLPEKEIVTNDIVELINETQFNFFGRYDHIINSGGIKIFPENVERKLQPYIDKRFIIGGIEDERLGQKVVLVIEGKEESHFNIEELSKIPVLDKYEVPKEILFIDKFFTTDNGKVIRGAVLSHIKNDFLA